MELCGALTEEATRMNVGLTADSMAGLELKIPEFRTGEGTG